MCINKSLLIITNYIILFFILLTVSFTLVNKPFIFLSYPICQTKFMPLYYSCHHFTILWLFVWVSLDIFWPIFFLSNFFVTCNKEIGHFFQCCLLHWVTATNKILVCDTEPLQQTEFLLVALSQCNKQNLYRLPKISKKTTKKFSKNAK